MYTSLHQYNNSPHTPTPTKNIQKQQDTFLPVLLQLRDDDNWRVRKAAIEALPVLGEHMDLALFDQRLLPHLLSAFQVCS